MRILVTGGTGYLGRHVVPALLQRGHQLLVVGRRAHEPAEAPGISYHSLELTKTGALAALVQGERFDAIVHLAGPAPKVDDGWGPPGVPLVAEHVRLALALREAFPTWSGRLVHASGMPVYGVPERLPIPESASRRPWHMYGLAKLLSEDVLSTWSNVDRWILRLPGLFSSERKSGALYHFMRAAAAGDPIQISASQPTPWDILHVADASEAILRCLTASAPGPGPINVSYGAQVDLVSIASWIAEYAGRGSRVENVSGITHPTFQMDIGLAEQLLDWPPASLFERLGALYHDYGFEVS